MATNSAESSTINHWFGGQEQAGASGKTLDVTNPATGQVTGRRSSPTPRTSRRRSPRRRPPPHWARASVSARTQVVFRFRELLNARKEELAAIITAEHGKVLSDALGEVARGQEVVEFACGIPHLLKGGYSPQVSTGVDVHSHPPAAGRRGHHQPVQLPGDGPDVVLPDRDRGRQRRRAQAQREGPVRVDLDRRALAGGRPARRRLHRAPGRQGRRRRAARTTPTSPRSASSARPRSRSTSTRPAPRTASGSRPSAAPRTTWSCCPTPTSTLAADAAVSAGYGSAGERCMAISVVVAVEPVGDDLVARIAERTARHPDRRRRTRADATDMGPLVTREHRDKVASLRRRRRGRRARRWSSTAATSTPTARADGFWLGPTLLRPRHARR